MFDDLILRISRLTDDPTVANTPTASLRQVLKLTGWQDTDRAKLQHFVDLQRNIDAAVADCRAHRNERIGHKRLAGVSSLPDATLRLVDDAIEPIETFVREMRQEFGRPDLEFVPLDASRDAEELMRHLLNRTSQQKPKTASIIKYVKGQRQADLHCAFCGERSPIVFYPEGETSPQLVSRMHYATCTGIVGHEVITLRAIEQNGEEEPRDFTLDLKLPVTEWQLLALSPASQFQQMLSVEATEHRRRG